MSSDAVVKSVGKKLRYYFEVKRLEEGFDLSGVNRPILDHPRLKPRKTLQCSLLKDVPLKHHFRSPSIRVRLTQFPGVNAPGSPREKQVKRTLERYITRSDFVCVTIPRHRNGKRPVKPWRPSRQHPYLSSYSYIHTSKGRKLRPESSSALYTGTRSSKKRGIKGGCPVIRSAPPHFVTKKQADRLVTVASKILVANETIDLKDHKPRPPNGPKTQSAPAPFETQRPLPTVESEFRPKTSRGFHHKNRYTDEGRDSAYTTDRTSPGSDEYLGRKNRQGSSESRSTKSSDSDAEHSPRPPAGGRPPTRRSRPASARTLQLNQVMDISHPLSGEVGIELGVQTRGTVAIQTDSRGDLTEIDLDEGDHIVRAGPPAQYHIYVRTGKRIGASTKAHVKITLYGEHGRSQEFLLAESQRHKIKFQKGHEDLFTIYTPHVGRLKCVKIGHDRPELMYAWFLEGVTVEDTVDKRVYECPCERWLSGQDGDKRTYRVLPVDRDRALIKDSDDDDSGSDVSYIKKYGQDTESERDDSPHNSPDSVRARRSARSSNSSSSDSETESDTETDTSSTSSESTQREITIPVKTPSTDVKVTQTVRSKPNQGEQHYEESKILVSPGRKMKDDFFDQRPAGPVYTFRTGTSEDSREDADTEKPELCITESDSETSKTTTSDYSETNKAAVIMPISRFPVIAEEGPKQHATPDTSAAERKVSQNMTDVPQRIVPRIAVDRVEGPVQTGGFSQARVVKGESVTERTSDSVATEKQGAIGEQLNQTLTVKKTTSTETTTTETGSNTDRTTQSGSATDRTTQSGSATDRTTQSGSGTERSTTTSGSSTDRTSTETEQPTDTKKVEQSGGKVRHAPVVNGVGAPATGGEHNTQKPKQAADSGTEDSDSDSDSSSSSGSESNSESDSVSDSDDDTPRPEEAKKTEEDKNGFSQKESALSTQVSQTITSVSEDTLHEAAKAGKLAAVTEIIHSHPDKINEINEVGWTALHVAASEGQLEVAQWLGQNGAELNRETPTGYSAIHLAALHGHVTTIKLLASLGGTVNCLTTDQQTPLHLAALSGHVEIAKWLIANGVDIEARDDSGRTALDLSIRNEQDEVTEYLRSCVGEDNSESGKPDVTSVENGTLSNSVTNHVQKSSEETSKPDSPKKHEEDLKEKRHLYEEQKSKMDESGLSFLDSIRQELDQD